ncbi:MAG: hypothetical protein KDJ29_10060, partial [Hyphomicrobiales bacterium]|nr:hypothetical protein [Hyphomicrobiales bacterium]
AHAAVDLVFGLCAFGHGGFELDLFNARRKDRETPLDRLPEGSLCRATIRDPLNRWRGKRPPLSSRIDRTDRLLTDCLWGAWERPRVHEPAPKARAMPGNYGKDGAMSTKPALKERLPAG